MFGLLSPGEVRHSCLLKYIDESVLSAEQRAVFAVDDGEELEGNIPYISN